MGGGAGGTDRGTCGAACSAWGEEAGSKGTAWPIGIGDGHTRSTERPQERWQDVASRAATNAGIDPSLTIVMVADPSDILPQTVFPLIDIQSEAWSLFFARVTPSNALHPSNSDMRKPVSNIQIFHSVPLGNMANPVQTYRLVKSLKVLRDWVDGDFRKWWDGFLGVRDAEAGGG